MKRQAAALFLCMAGLLTVAVLNILNQHSDSLLRAHSKTIAGNWATYLVETIPDINAAIGRRAPTADELEIYARGNRFNRIRSFIVFDANGDPAFTYRPADTADALAANTAGPQPGSSVFAANAPIVMADKTVGSVTVTVNQRQLSNLYVKAATAGAVEILVLVNLALLGCWFLYTLLTRAAKQHSIALSRHDELTGLPSRIGFVEELESSIPQLANAEFNAAVLVIKIDRFREINDVFGHRCADEVLRNVADTLHRLSDSHGFAARLSGNTFGVFFPRMSGREDTADWARKINDALSAPITVQSNRIQPKSSVGIAMTPTDGTDVQTLLKRADLAQFIAHEKGGNRHRFYDSETAADFSELHSLETLVERACDEERFELFFQPLFDLKARRLSGFEALVRMRDDNGDFVSPEKFIPVAESLHRIHQLGTWVIRTACQTAVQWPEQLGIAVNLSPAQFDNADLAKIVREALDTSGLAPERLELEVTEGLLLEDTSTTRAQLIELQRAGVRIALDDFGTGYSSLSYLWQFPFDRIKIDRSFVAGMGTNDQAAGILTTIVELARTMKLPITAEGIETDEQLEYLTSLGCDTGQGYLLGRPQPASELAASVLDDFRSRTGQTDDDAPDISRSAAAVC